MKTLIIQLLLLILLGACTQKEQIREVRTQTNPDPAPAGTPAPSKNGATGTIHGGGGNILKKKTVEDYRRDPFLNIPVVEKLVVPLINKISKKLPPLAGDLYYILIARAWYLIPGELNNLPGYSINAPFETQQGAFQTSREVWINAILFSEMPPESQASLIFHELVMGVRRMQYAKALEHCLADAEAFRFVKDDKLATRDQKRRDCWEQEGKSLLPSVSFADLTQNPLEPEDYSHVRILNSDLIKYADSIDVDELIPRLKREKFRDYSKWGK